MNSLDWVDEVKPNTPAKSNGWGKKESSYHLSEDYGIEIWVNGALITKWKWASQSEASSRQVQKKYWEKFLKEAKDAKNVVTAATKEAEKSDAAEETSRISE